MMEIRLKSTYLELLFLCLCLLTVLGPANGETVVRVNEGSEAVLPCLIRPERDITGDVFDWRKDDQKEVFLYDRGSHYNNGRDGQDKQFKKRVSHFPDQLQFGNASIVIRDTIINDTGRYTCDYAPAEVNRQTSYIELVVDWILKDRSEKNIRGASLKPCVTLLEQTTGSSMLQCEVRRVSPKPKVEWQDSSGNNLHAEPQITERGGSYNIILKTTVNKTDNYSCVVTQEEIHHQVSDEISVNIHGPEPVSGLPIGLVVAALLNPLIIVVGGGVVLAVLYKKRVITINSKKGSQIDKKKNPTELDELNKKFDTSGV